MNRLDSTRRRWDCAGQELPLDEMLADPVVRLVLTRDGLTREDVIGVMREARRHRGLRQEPAIA